MDTQMPIGPLTDDKPFTEDQVMATHSWMAAETARPIAQGVPAVGSLARFWRWLAACRQRAAERRELRELAAKHALYDLSPKRVREEAAKPFWVE